MKSCLTGFVILLLSLSGKSQITYLANMPEKVSNNAVVGGFANGEGYVYSFAGIDSTKKWSGIHKKAFRYSKVDNSWETIPSLPGGTGRIAAGASNVKNKIYIIGGYEVFSNGNERTLDEVHIYDPETNSYLPDGKRVPVPIDDHVQAVYKDSLIFVVTGWSQNTNVRNVQIYNPSTDEWSVGTSVPNSTHYKVFGASGTIVGDTLYYLGGARIGSTFPASNFMKKGYINPNDPTEISWTATQITDSEIYRGTAATNYWLGPLWFGGSSVTYNYDGIAYNGSGGVKPNGNIKLSNIPFPKIMDHRGLADFGGEYVFAGGMNENQEVIDSVFLINFIQSDLPPSISFYSKIFPNPVTEMINIETGGRFDVTIYDRFGQKLINDSSVNKLELSLEKLPTGVFFLKIENESGFQKIEKIIKTDSF